MTKYSVYFQVVMAKPSLELIRAIRNAAQKLEGSAGYQWGHMGACNCGYLAQEVTKLPKEEIHRRAMTGYGDWSEQLNDYCPSSGMAMDQLISDLIAFGFDAEDLKHLERLSDREILITLPETQRDLSFNVKAHVVKYMKAWASMLEEELLKNVTLPVFKEKDKVILVLTR